MIKFFVLEGKIIATNPETQVHYSVNGMVLDGEVHIVIRHHTAFPDQDITLDGALHDNGKFIKGKYIIDKHTGPDPQGVFQLIANGPAIPFSQ